MVRASKLVHWSKLGCFDHNPPSSMVVQDCASTLAHTSEYSTAKPLGHGLTPYHIIDNNSTILCSPMPPYKIVSHSFLPINVAPPDPHVFYDIEQVALSAQEIESEISSMEWRSLFRTSPEALISTGLIGCLAHSIQVPRTFHCSHTRLGMPHLPCENWMALSPSYDVCTAAQHASVREFNVDNVSWCRTHCLHRSKAGFQCHLCTPSHLYQPQHGSRHILDLLYMGCEILTSNQFTRLRCP